VSLLPLVAGGCRSPAPTSRASGSARDAL
jgi:hypothetical protein